MNVQIDLDQLMALLEKMGCPGPILSAHPLAGGVSSDIWQVNLPTRIICIKKALPRLKVASVWEAPVARNSYEYLWMQTVGEKFPGAVPGLVGHDENAGLFAMEFLPPEEYPVWKNLMLAGIVNSEHGAAVGTSLGGIHRWTANKPEVASDFSTDGIFEPIRIEPYLLATARVHQDLASRIESVAQRLRTNKKALVHGDVSPKNILMGPDGPVFLDSECAWYGDPAFDVAFCLNHLLLKCAKVSACSQTLLKSFRNLRVHYMAEVDWESPKELEERIAQLLPILLLARVDGKSPVEYFDMDQKATVREQARELIQSDFKDLGSIADFWEREWVG